MYTWLTANKLAINAIKFHFLVFHIARMKNTEHTIKLKDTNMDRVKFIGVIMDEKIKTC